MTGWGRRHGSGDRHDVGQGLAIEGVGQDRLHGVIAILADRERAGAGGVQPSGAVALGQAQDALGAAQPIQRPIAEELLDELLARGADISGAGATPGRRLQEEVDLIGGEMRGEGAPLAGTRPTVRGDEDVVLIQLDLEVRGPDPEPLADEAMGRGVVGAGKDDMAVGMELGPFPLGQLPGGDGQRLQRRAFHLVEDFQGDLLGRPVDAAAGGLDGPAEQMAGCRRGDRESCDRPGRCV